MHWPVVFHFKSYLILSYFLFLPKAFSQNHVAHVGLDMPMFLSVAADNRQPALYGGRMTASRLFHVGQVTSEAVEQLHK